MVGLSRLSGVEVSWCAKREKLREENDDNGKKGCDSEIAIQARHASLWQQATFPYLPCNPAANIISL